MTTKLFAEGSTIIDLPLSRSFILSRLVKNHPKRPRNERTHPWQQRAFDLGYFSKLWLVYSGIGVKRRDRAHLRHWLPAFRLPKSSRLSHEWDQANPLALVGHGNELLPVP